MKRAFLIVITSCGYTAGSFHDFKGTFPGTAQTIGCVELAVGTASDPLATGPVLAYSFGNRCTHAVTLDLATVRAVGRDADGRDHALVAFDPRGELRPVPLDGLWSAREQIEYVVAERERTAFDPRRERPVALQNLVSARDQIEYVAPVPVELVSVCVDIGGVDASAPRTEHWVCTDVHTLEASR